MLNSVEHEKCLITSGRVCISISDAAEVKYAPRDIPLKIG